jgi:hypothetical protein
MFFFAFELPICTQYQSVFTRFVPKTKIWGSYSKLKGEYNSGSYFFNTLARMGEERGLYRFLVGKPEGKGPLGRPRRRWVDNIRTDFQEVGCGYMDWIGLAQDRDRWRRLVSAVMNLGVP